MYNVCVFTSNSNLLYKTAMLLFNRVLNFKTEQAKDSKIPPFLEKRILIISEGIKRA